MVGQNDGLWHTLDRIYTAILACGVCVPAAAAVPVLLGVDSLLAALCFGSVGLGVAGGVVVLVDARLTAAAAVPPGGRTLRERPGGDVAGTTESGST